MKKGKVLYNFFCYLLMTVDSLSSARWSYNSLPLTTARGQQRL